MAAWILVLIGWAFAIVMMMALWAVQRARNDAGVVDVGWAAGLGVIAIIYAVLAGGPWRHRLLVAAAGIWSARLATYIFFNRVRGKPEDGRYRTLRAKWQALASRGDDYRDCHGTTNMFVPRFPKRMSP